MQHSNKPTVPQIIMNWYKIGARQGLKSYINGSVPDTFSWNPSIFWLGSFYWERTLASCIDKAQLQKATKELEQETPSQRVTECNKSRDVTFKYFLSWRVTILQKLVHIDNLLSNLLSDSYLPVTGISTNSRDAIVYPLSLLWSAVIQIPPAITRCS